MVGPLLEKGKTHLKKGKIILEKYVQIGANSIILPFVRIGEGSVTGAFSLVKSDIPAWMIYAGIPAVRLKSRKKEMLKYIEGQ
jgi:acetyltransferase-like isoleucine patch superfamily enzyme